MNRTINSVLIVTFLMMGCATSAAHRIYSAQNIASAGQLKPSPISTQLFELQAFYKLQNSQYPLRVFIEGDGFAWVNRHHASQNPTPKNPISLKLASIDTNPNVLYLGRPCQYIQGPNCGKSLWTDARFSEDVIQSMNEAINIFLSKHSHSSIEIVGFSGGGAIATILAARRNDVTKLITVAGNLNHEAVNRYHNVDSLKSSLNPIHAVSRISHIPQTHYSGAEDKIIPSKIIKHFVSQIPQPNNAKHIIVNEASHTDGWDKIWPDLIL